MNHEEISGGPTPPELNMPQLTPPTLGCLEPEERKAVGELVPAVIEAVKTQVEALIGMAMDNFVAMGSHVVGHGLQTMIWSAFQSSLIRHGQPMHDATTAVVSLAAEDDQPLTEADLAEVEMVTEFVRGTIGGAHVSAMNVWVDWVNSLPADSEKGWELYCRGVAALVGQALFIATAEQAPGGELGDAVMGGPSAVLRSRSED